MNKEIKYRFWYAHDNKMYGVLSVSARFPDEDFNRVFIARELSHGEPLNYRADVGQAHLDRSRHKFGKKI